MADVPPRNTTPAPHVKKQTPAAQQSAEEKDLEIPAFIRRKMM
jgi:hypothetical protein